MTNASTPKPGTMASGAARYRNRPGVPKAYGDGQTSSGGTLDTSTAANRQALFARAESGDVVAAGALGQFYLNVVNGNYLPPGS